MPLPPSPAEGQPGVLAGTLQLPGGGRERGGSRWGALQAGARAGKPAPLLDLGGCFSLRVTRGGLGQRLHPLPRNLSCSRLVLSYSNTHAPHPINPWGKWEGDWRGVGAWPQPPLPSTSWGCRHLFIGPGAMNPRPNHTTSQPSDWGGVVWGGTDRDPAPPPPPTPCNSAQPGFSQSSELGPGALPTFLGPRWGRASAPLSQVRP